MHAYCSMVHQWVMTFIYHGNLLLRVCLRLVSANNAKNGVQLLLLAAAIVNNDSFPVFVVYGRVANPCSMYYLWAYAFNRCARV